MDFGWPLALGLTAILLAIPGLGMRRFGPLSVRLVALLAIASLLLAALDWPLSSPESRPSRVRAVATADAPASLLDFRSRLEAQGVEFAAPAFSGGLAERLLQARLQDPEADLLLLWNGSFVPQEDSGSKPLPATPLSDRANPPLEPEWFQLRALGALRADRPLALELRLEEGAELGPWRGSLQLLDSMGEARASLEFAAAELVEPLRLEAPDVSAGAYEIELRIELPGAGSLLATGSLVVASSPILRIVGSGRRSMQIAAALTVQGLAAEVVEELPADLAEEQVLVLCEPLSEAEQTRVLDFVDAGGGLFLIGDEQGGALPLSGQPLHDFLPVVMPAVLRVAVAKEGAEGDAGSSEEASETEPEPEPKADPVPPEENPKKPDPEAAPSGDLSQASPPVSLNEEEVERRSVALMLVVDRSGSMGQPSSGGRSKMDDAKRSAYDTAYNLEDGDELGLIAFGEHAQELEILKLGPPPKDSVLRRSLESLRAEAPRTQLGSALNLSLTRLAASKLPVRHTVVITDGNLPEFADVLHCRTVADRMAKAGITLSIIQVIDPGDSSSPLELKRIADAGRGVLHRSRARDSIPSLVLSEVKRLLGSVGRRPASELAADPLAAAVPEPEAKPVEAKPEPEPEPDPEPEPEPAAEQALPASDAGPAVLAVRAVSPSLLLQPLPEAGFPGLAGVLPVTGRAEARVLLAAGEQGVPLLAFANRGLGRVGVWTSDFFGNWGRDWVGDPQLPARLATWVSAVFPASDADAEEQLLVSRVLQPPAPTRAERRQMEALTGQALAQLSEYEAPAAKLVMVEKGRAAEFALWALLSLAFLALVEFSLRRSAAFS